MNKPIQKVLLLGPGLMGREYAKVLQDLNISFDVIGRGEKTAGEFLQATGIKSKTGGIESLSPEEFHTCSEAIVATDTEHMANHAIFLMKNGIHKILLEKPGALNTAELKEIQKVSRETGSNVVLAYNRRFYSSVLELKNRILEDGGLDSIFFDFTEWAFKIEPMDFPAEVKQNWLLRNSSHVIDLAFYLGGRPLEMQAYSAGELNWHPKSIFTGSGKTNQNILFAYHSNWDSAGRWRLEFHTKKNKWILCPLEKLQYTPKGSTEIREFSIQDDIDIKYKHGIFKMTQAWAEGNFSEFSNIDDQVGLSEILDKIMQGQR